MDEIKKEIWRLRWNVFLGELEILYRKFLLVWIHVKYFPKLTYYKFRLWLVETEFEFFKWLYNIGD